MRRNEAREADLFLAELLRGGTQRLDSPGPGRVLREGAVRRRPSAQPGAGYGELVEVCGFFGPNDVRKSEQQIRDAVVAWAQAEWTTWHTAAGAPRLASDAALFGRLIGYYLAAEGRFLPDTLTAMQAAALGGINYGPFLTGATTAIINSEVARIRGLLLAGAPGAADANVPGRVDTAIRQARQAHLDVGDFRSWSADFVSSVVRGVGIAQGLEAVIAPAQQHVGRDELLLASGRHATYTAEARDRKAAALPRRRGTYHAFAPTARAPQPGDIIVQDRRDTINAANQVMTLPACPPRLKTHGDLVIEVQPAFVVTVGGNLGLSVRKRRYPRDGAGMLVVDRRQLYAQEDDTGALAAVPLLTALPLADRSTARIFALLSPVEECAAVPGQPYRGGILT